MRTKERDRDRETTGEKHHHQSTAASQHLELALLLPTLLEALINLHTRLLRDTLPELVNILPCNNLSESVDQGVILHRKQSCCNASKARVLRGEGSQRHGRVAVGVDLVVHGALVKDCRFAGTDLVADHTGLVLAVEDEALGDGFGVDLAGDHGEEFGGPGMGVDSDHGAT